MGLIVSDVRTLTLEEAIAGLGKWLELAVEGEAIRIRTGDAVVELRPVSEKDGTRRVSPREALRQLQAEARLTPAQGQAYFRELREERLVAETRRSA